jgi:hypothetical protein
MARPKPFRCPDCKRDFISLGALNMHRSAKHPAGTVFTGRDAPGRNANALARPWLVIRILKFLCGNVR